MRATELLTAIYLLAAGVPSASAICYEFASGNAVRVKAEFTITRVRPTIVPGAGRIIQYDYTGTYTTTIGQSTQTFSGAAQGSVNYEGVPSTVPWTGFVLTSSANVFAAFTINLFGVGDLMPDGFNSPLPALSSWNWQDVPGRQPNIIQIITSPIQKYTIDAIGSCGGPPNPRLGSSSNNPGSCHCGDPIDIGTGNLFEQVDDYQTAGENKLRFSRFYNSLAAADTVATTLGANWRSTYDRHLRIVSSSSVVAERPDGLQVTFALSGGNWSTEADLDFRLTQSGANWTLTGPDDTVETYRTAGNRALLESVRARNGYTQRLEYNGNLPTAVTDSFGRELSFTYQNGLLRTVTTPDDLTLNYDYTSAGSKSLLTSVTYSTTPSSTLRYVYDNAAFPAALTGVIDENGARYATWTYDANGRALSSELAGGAGLTRVAYNDSDDSRTVTYPLGVQLVYRFTTLRGVPKVTQIDRLATATTAAASQRFTYDANGYRATQSDWNGYLTTYQNDARGRPTRIVEAFGTSTARLTTLTYHANFNLPLTIVEPGLTTSFTYDSSGNVLTKIYTDTTTTTTPYSTNGTTRTWTYTWSNFLLASVKQPRTDVESVTRFAYDDSGALVATTNAAGQTTRTTRHLPGGLPQTIVDPNGVTTELTYDARQRLLSRTIQTAAGPLTTSYTYDAAGNLLSVTRPDGSPITNRYDAAHRLTAMTDLFNQSITHTLDALGNRTATNWLDSTGRVQRTRSATFDSIGRLRQDSGGAGQATAYTYDANDNVLTATDALRRQTVRAFDALNRLVKITDPLNSVTTKTYDAKNRLTSVADPNGGTTSYVYSGFGEMIQRSSPDTGTTVYRYDPSGNLIQRVDGAGTVCNYTYDALDRMLTRIYPANPAENVIYTYDQAENSFSAGRLSTITDQAGTLSMAYDERGNLLRETRVNGNLTLTTSYIYDAADRVVSVTYPSGWTASYTRDAMGRITDVAAQPPNEGVPIPVLANVAYLPFGPVKSLAFGNNVLETRSFDADYRLTGIVDAGAATVQNLAYSYDRADNVLAVQDGLTPAASQTFGYDAFDRLTSAQGAYGRFVYTYDGVGNRLTQSLDGSPATYNYALRTNRLVSVNTGNDRQTVTHSSSGNVDSFTPASGSPLSFRYNQARRLASVSEGDNLLAQYTYDGFGRRVRKVRVRSGTTLYQYDPNGHLLEEMDGDGNAVVDYVYLDGVPVATISPAAGQVYFLHTDRLGTPQVATDASQNVAWTASYRPFGETNTTLGLIVQNLRLPGQEFDIDTGLYHNGFRDYAPGWGRYVQADPVGLAGGLNTYAYAGGNPIRAADPLGLAPTASSSSDPLVQKYWEEANASTANTIRLNFPDGTMLDVQRQWWEKMTLTQQQDLLSEMLADVPPPQPCAFKFFQYVSGLIGKDKYKPKEYPGWFHDFWYYGILDDAPDMYDYYTPPPELIGGCCGIRG